MKGKNLAAFCFFNFILWCLCSLLYFRTGGFFTDGLGLTFTALFILGHLFLFGLGICLLSAPWRLLGQRPLACAAVGWGTLFTLFFAADILVYSQYRFHISPAMLQLFFGPAGKEIFVFPASTWVMAAVFACLVVAGEYGLMRLAKRTNPSGKLILSVLGVLLLIFMGYNGLYAWGRFMLVPSVAAQRDRLPFANPLSANRRLRKMGFEPKSTPYTLPKQGTLHYPLNPLICTPEKPANVLVLLVESWRTDVVTPEVMPHLTAWAKRPNATYFADHLSGGNATEAGVFSLFYSMPYAYWTDFTSRHLPPVLVSEAQKLGYQTAIYSSGKLNSPAFNQNIFADIADLRLESKGKEKWERDVDAVNGFEDFLAHYNQTSPFFGFVFLDAPHGSDSPQEDQIFQPAGEMMNYLTLTKNTDPTPYMNRYKNSLHFTDRMLHRIFSALEKHGLLQNTLVVLTGDHGQEINDTRHNFWGHNSNFAKYQTHVPLFVWRPGQTAPHTASWRTTHYDVAPTVLKTAYGCQNPAADYSIGMDLFDPSPRPFALISSYTKKAIRTGDKLTVMDAYGNLEFYDENFVPTQTGADPVAVAEALKTFAKFYK